LFEGMSRSEFTIGRSATANMKFPRTRLAVLAEPTSADYGREMDRSHYLRRTGDPGGQPRPNREHAAHMTSFEDPHHFEDYCFSKDWLPFEYPLAKIAHFQILHTSNDRNSIRRGCEWRPGIARRESASGQRDAFVWVALSTQPRTSAGKGECEKRGKKGAASWNRGSAGHFIIVRTAAVAPHGLQLSATTRSG
jgi:hypothetical protein